MGLAEGHPPARLARVQSVFLAASPNLRSSLDPNVLRWRNRLRLDVNIVMVILWLAFLPVAFLINNACAHA